MPALMPDLADDPRVTIRRAGPFLGEGRSVLCWLQRAQRAHDNPSLDLAITIANRLRLPVVAYIALVPGYPRANLRHYRFMIDGWPELGAALRARGVGFVVRRAPDCEVSRVATEAGAAVVIGDENPLREMERWRRLETERLRVPFWTVDADVVVPTRVLEKEQYAARTIRPRIARHLAWFLAPSREERAAVDPRLAPRIPSLRPGATLLRGFDIDRRIGPVSTFPGGRAEGLRRLARFLNGSLRGYAETRNHPEADATSHLSPYLHFGQLGPREVALAVRDADAPSVDRDAFLEQLIVRRELAVNFVRFNSRYDRLDGCEPWARETLDRHRSDPRTPRYSRRELEAADTHDELWNAAQRQMVATGWMHGYVRMYWAKKILEWSASPERAFAVAIELNDRYLLDGRDPNGYAGVAWAVGGKHDRPWPERDVFGTIRYMSAASTGRKFDSKRYIERMKQL